MQCGARAPSFAGTARRALCTTWRTVPCLPRLNRLIDYAGGRYDRHGRGRHDDRPNCSGFWPRSGNGCRSTWPSRSDDRRRGNRPERRRTAAIRLWHDARLFAGLYGRRWHWNVFSGGGRVVKNAAGYNMCRLMAGSLGTLGIITQATLMVRPLPEAAALLACEIARFRSGRTPVGRSGPLADAAGGRRASGRPCHAMAIRCLVRWRRAASAACTSASRALRRRSNGCLANFDGGGLRWA